MSDEHQIFYVKNKKLMHEGDVVDLKLADRIAVANKLYYAEKLCENFNGWTLWIDPEDQKIVKSEKPE